MIYHMPLNMINQQRGVHIQWTEPNPSALFAGEEDGDACDCPYGEDEGPEELILTVTPAGGGDPIFTTTLSRVSGCGWFGSYSLHCNTPNTDISLTAAVEIGCEDGALLWVVTWYDISQGELDCIPFPLGGEKTGMSPVGTYESTSGYGVEITEV